MKKVFIFLTTLLLNICVWGTEFNVRIGWQIPWATQGQLVQILKHTEILDNNSIKAEFVGRTYGPELNELALSDKIDVVLTGDQPGVALLAKDKGWVIIGRLMYNRTAIYVPLNSKINSVNDLKGKTIGLPIGAAAERTTKDALKKAGIDYTKDVKIQNLGIQEHTPLIKKYLKKEKWGKIDALSGFDPTPAVLETSNYVKTIDVGTVVSLIIMKKETLDLNPGLKDAILNSFVDAYDYYRQNVTQANTWFVEESKFNDPDFKACNLASSIEPNLKVKSKDEIRVSFTTDDIERLQDVVSFMEPTTKKDFSIELYMY